mmetsp:Transcript_21416/g.54101  ORF Transcript_21416/g.54101 Transcript_21416/m.54101 type:complete len:337 (-) Transcript_21416:688-1698(-)
MAFGMGANWSARLLCFAVRQGVRLVTRKHRGPRYFGILLHLLLRSLCQRGHLVFHCVEVIPDVGDLEPQILDLVHPVFQHREAFLHLSVQHPCGCGQPRVCGGPTALTGQVARREAQAVDADRAAGAAICADSNAAFGIIAGGFERGCCCPPWCAAGESRVIAIVTVEARLTCRLTLPARQDLVHAGGVEKSTGKLVLDTFVQLLPRLLQMSRQDLLQCLEGSLFDMRTDSGLDIQLGIGQLLLHEVGHVLKLAVHLLRYVFDDLASGLQRFLGLLLSFGGRALNCRDRLHRRLRGLLGTKRHRTRRAGLPRSKGTGKGGSYIRGRCDLLRRCSAL